jgi:hypothetical protein
MDRIDREQWHKSSYSGSNGGGCVEIAERPGQVLVRDSKDQEGPVLAFTPEQWRAFAAAVRRGDYDLS